MGPETHTCREVSQTWCKKVKVIPRVPKILFALKQIVRKLDNINDSFSLTIPKFI